MTGSHAREMLAREPVCREPHLLQRREGLRTQNSSRVLRRRPGGSWRPRNRVAQPFASSSSSWSWDFLARFSEWHPHGGSGAPDTLSYKRLRYIRSVLAQALNGLLSVTWYYL